MIDNIPFLIRAVVSSAVLLYYTFFLTRRQWSEIGQPKDGYTTLRTYILYILLVALITLAPSVVYQFIIAFGSNSPWLRNFVSIVGGINLVSTALLLHLVFTYRVKR